MKKMLMIALSAVVLIGTTACAQEQQAFDIGKVSESFGHLIAKHLQNPSLHFDIDKIIKGMRDELAGIPSPMNEAEYESAIAQIQESICKQIAEKNLNDANVFLEKNATEQGIISLEPKLQYQILKQGEGQAVSAESTPLVHYMGKLLDGTVFGNSYEMGDPIVLPIAHTIPGFSKGLIGMKEGEKRRIFVHPDLAYGSVGQLPPNSLLIFEVEIVKQDSGLQDVLNAEPAAS